MIFGATTTVKELPEAIYKAVNGYNKWYTEDPQEFYDTFCKETDYDPRDYQDRHYP